MPASLLLVCGTCKHEFRVPENLEGQKVFCVHCRNPVEVVAGIEEEKKKDKLIGREIGQCRLVRRVGAGAMGAVYEGEQLADGRQVAVKLLSPKSAANQTLVKRFRREARLAAELQHPNAIGVFNHGFEKNVHFLIMEYVEGDTMAAYIERQGKLPWREAADLTKQIAQGLDRLAEEGIIHRDIKPANVLVTADGVAKLADLGLAKQADAGGDAMSLVTMSGAVMGSPAYMAPEQARDSTEVSHASDVYSLGASFYQAVTGELAFEGKNAMEVIRKVLSEDPTPPKELVEGLPQGVNDLILEMMEKDQGKRMQTHAEVVAAIDEVLADPDAPRKKKRRKAKRKIPVPTSGGRPAPTRAKGGSKAWLWILLVLLLLAGAAATWWFWARHAYPALNFVE